MTHKEITYLNKKLHYTICGTGSVVMLLHGFAEDYQIWINQIDTLSKNYTVIAPDLPGSGLSEQLDNADVSMEDFAKAIHAIILGEKIEKFILIGHSMGGYIALAYEELFSTYLLALGLFHSTAFSDDELKIASRSKAISFIQDHGAAAFLKTIIPDLYADQGKSIIEIEQHLLNGGSISAETLEQYYQAMMHRKDKSSLLNNLQRPVLFVAGCYDKLIPIQHSIQQSKMPACSFINILKKSGHMGMLEEAKETGILLSNFIEYTCKKSW